MEARPRKRRRDSADAESPHSEALEWSEKQIASELHATASRLLVRGAVTTLIARKYAGELLWVAAKQFKRDRRSFEAFSLVTVGLRYSDARKHIQLFIHWPKVEAVVDRTKKEAETKGRPVVIPGYYRLLKMAGVIEDRRKGHSPPDDPGDPVELLDITPEVINDFAAALEIICKLQGALRAARADIVKLKNDLSLTNATVYELRAELGKGPKVPRRRR